jgi:hypothetical protein
MREREDIDIDAAPQQQRDDVAAAIEAMSALPLLDKCTVFVQPLLADQEARALAIAALLGSLRVLSMRLSDQERLAVAVQMCAEARRIADGWLH